MRIIFFCWMIKEEVTFSSAIFLVWGEGEDLKKGDREERIKVKLSDRHFFFFLGSVYDSLMAK